VARKLKTTHRTPQNSILVVAHPDDEILWFSSVLQHVNTVILVFQDYFRQPALGSRRAKAVAELPYRVHTLQLAESGSYRQANWSRPIISSYGLELNDPAVESDIAAHYRRNFNAILHELDKHLEQNMTVYTHNPWGEYGHEDHVQVFRAVQQLISTKGFCVRVPAYVSSRSQSLASMYTMSDNPDLQVAETNGVYCNDVADIYKRHKCWTWADDWYWNDVEHFIECPDHRQVNEHALAITDTTVLTKIPCNIRHRRL
jgi:LmbE family N-acetylglucosaminyl deacetylase